MTQGRATQRPQRPPAPGAALRPGLRSHIALGVMRSRHGATVIPSHDLECGKSAIAANNQRQSRQQHAARQRGIWTHIPAAMTEEGLGAGPGAQKKKHAPICFGFSPSLQSCPAPLGFRVKPWVLQEDGTEGAGTRRALRGQRCPAGTGDKVPLSHLSRAPVAGIWDTGTRLCRPRVAGPFCHLDSTKGHGQ